MFLPESGGPNLSSGDYFYDKDALTITFYGCNSNVGESPTGSLMIDSISTPLSIKDSGNFYVRVFKDETGSRTPDTTNMSLIAKINAGVYVEATTLEPGTITDITLTPKDKAVQKVTEHTITFVNEHILSETGMIKITFPTGLTVPPVGTEMEIVPLNDSMTATKGYVSVTNEVTIEDIFKGIPTEDLP